MCDDDGGPGGHCDDDRDMEIPIRRISTHPAEKHIVRLGSSLRLIYIASPYSRGSKIKKNALPEKYPIPES